MQQTQNNKKVNILIVDDDDAIREAMKEFLEMQDYNADAVSSAEEAIDFLKMKEGK